MGSWTPPPLPTRLSALRRVPLVGRRLEREVLEDTWEEVAASRRQALFIGGEPGVGKTRLAAEAAIRLHEEGAAVLVGISAPEPGIPYRPFAEIIGHLFSHGSPPEEMVGPRASLLAHLSNEVSRHAHPAAGSPTTREELYGAVAGLFADLAAMHPLVLVLDDLQWAQLDTLALLTYVVETTLDARLLVVGTFRTTAPDHSDQLTQRLADLHRLEGVRRLDLSGLDSEDIAAYLVEQGGVPLPEARSLAPGLRDLTGGNPFFLRELWHDVSRRRGVAALRDPGEVPSSVRDTLATRLDRLGASTRQVLELAAVVGDRFDVALLIGTNQDRGHVLSAVDAATAAGLIQPERDSDGGYEFVHALARQAVLDELAPSRRMDLHARVATALDSDDPLPEVVPKLADHYLNAHGLGYDEQALHYAAEAGELAERSLAHDEAARWFGRAAALPTATNEQRAALLLASANNRLRAGDFAGARDTYAGLASFSDPAVRLEAAMGFEDASWRPGLADPRAAELLSEALAAYEPAPQDLLHTRALASLGRALSFAGATERARRVGDRALETARRQGDAATVAHALEASLWHGLTPEDVGSELARATELSDLAREAGEHEALGVAAHFRAVAAYMLADAVHLDSASSDLHRAAAALNQPFFNYVMECVAQGQALLAADFPAAERRAEAALRMGRAFGVDTTEGSHGVQMFLLRRETGRLEDFRSLLDGHASFEGRWVAGLLALFTELRMEEGAARALRHLLGRDLDAMTVEAQWPIEMVFMAEGALFLEDRDAARMLVPHLARYRGMNLVGGQFVAPLGSADCYLARLQALLGDEATAEELFRSASLLNERIGSVIHTAETHAHHAVFAFRRGDEARATRLAARARQLAQAFGQRRTFRTLEELSPPALPAGLTRREVEVLGLLGEGLSNREIADRLFISAHTAANHVRSIFTKTGTSNRTQAAMYAAEQDLL